MCRVKNVLGQKCVGSKMCRVKNVRVKNVWVKNVRVKNDLIPKYEMEELNLVFKMKLSYTSKKERRYRAEYTYMEFRN